MVPVSNPSTHTFHSVKKICSTLTSLPKKNMEKICNNNLVKCWILNHQNVFFCNQEQDRLRPLFKLESDTPWTFEPHRNSNQMPLESGSSIFTIRREGGYCSAFNQNFMSTLIFMFWCLVAFLWNLKHFSSLDNGDECLKIKKAIFSFF